MATAYSLKSFSKQPPLKRAEAVANGLPVRLLRDLVSDSAITIADLTGVVGPRRTLDRRLKDDQGLSARESDRLAHFVDILDLATEIFGSRKAAMDWLRAPKDRFEGASPLEVMRTFEGGKFVETVLLQAKHSFFA